MPGFIDSSFLSKIKCVAIYTFILLIITISANAREITLQWDPNSEPDLSHYVVYWGTASGSYSNYSGDIGLVTSYSCLIPDDGLIYYFAVTAVDEAGLESDYSNEVNTDGAVSGNAPTADAGPDQNVNDRSVVYLDGSNSIDPDGGSLTYEWTQTGGSDVILNNSTSSQPHFNSPSIQSEGGALTFQLTVIDEEGFQAADSCIVNIISVNNPPAADAGPDQSVYEGEVVILNGAGSSDSDGDMLSFMWTQVSGPAVTLNNSNEIYASFQTPDVTSAGDYLTFELTTKDPDGLQSKDRCIINVLCVNEAPVADAGMDQTVDLDTVVTLSGYNSTDLDDGIVSYLWTQTSGITVNLSDPTTANPTFIAATEGALIFRLTVTDAGGLQASDSCIINVTVENLPPISDAGIDQTVNEGDFVQLDGSASVDPEGSILSCLWTQTAGTSVTLSDSTAVNPGFTAPQEGSLVFTLITTDADGLKSSDNCTVNVVHVNQSPVAHAGEDQFVKEGDTVVLDASASTDQDNGIAGFLWTQTGGSSVVLSDPTDFVATFVAPPANETDELITFELTVTDNGGLISTASINIMVSDNGITAFPDDVISIMSNTGLPVGITVDNGGACTSLSAVDPLTIPDDSNAPDDLLYGLLNFRIKVSRPGDAAVVSIYLSEPVSEDYSWYKFDSDTGWGNFSEYAVFNDDRTKVTLTLIDGGPGDEDKTENGEIVDPSGPGLMSSSSLDISGNQEFGDNNAFEGAGGCFISAASCDSTIPDWSIDMKSAYAVLVIIMALLSVSFLILLKKRQMNFK